jgi:hypothetical protein
MRRLAASAGVTVIGIAAMTLAGCTAAATATDEKAAVTMTGRPLSHPVQPDAWEVGGTFQLEGGPVQPGGKNPPVRPLRGVVTFRDSKGHSVNVTVGASGKFSVNLRAGTYTVTGRSPQIEQQNADGKWSDPTCSAPVTAVVRPQPSNQVVVTCIVP